MITDGRPPLAPPVPLPVSCPEGHDLTGPGLVLTAWLPCPCAAPRHAGHVVHMCRPCAPLRRDTAHYTPPHTPAWETIGLPVETTGAWRVTNWAALDAGIPGPPSRVKGLLVA